MKKKQATTIVIYILLIAWSLFVLFPLLWAISTSFKPRKELFQVNITWIPKNPTLENYAAVFSNPKMMRYLINTMFVASASSLIVVVVASMGGYAFSRYNLKGRRAGIMAIVSVQMFPPIMFIVPYFVLMKRFGFYNSYYALIITRVVFFIPFSTLMIKSFCDSIPNEIEEAAIVEGATQFYTFVRIIVPLLIPAVATITIFTFLNSWNEYLFSITVVSKDSLRTITAGLSSMVGQYGVNWGQLMALSVMSIVIPLMIFVSMQNFFIKGLTAGAIKG